MDGEFRFCQGIPTGQGQEQAEGGSWVPSHWRCVTLTEILSLAEPSLAVLASLGLPAVPQHRRGLRKGCRLITSLVI